MRKPPIIAIEARNTPAQAVCACFDPFRFLISDSSALAPQFLNPVFDPG